MEYTIDRCYADLEQLLKRPLNTLDYQNVSYWFETYPSDYVHATIITLKNVKIYKSNYISSALASKFDFYKALKQINGESIEEIKPTKKYSFDL